MTNNERLAALHSARAGLNADDRSLLTHTMLGALAYYVDDNAWSRALESAIEMVKEPVA